MQHCNLEKMVDDRGGAMLYVKSNLKIIGIDSIILNSGNALKIKIRICRGDCDSNSGEGISIVVVYKDCRSSKNDFVREFEEKIVSRKEKNEIIVGDMNINILNEDVSAPYINMLMMN